MTSPFRFSTRRMALTALAAAGLFAVTAATAQTAYPSQPMKLVIPYPAGGATDTLGRLIAQKIQENWNNPVVVENRAGAGGTIGNNFVAKSAPDGHTVLLAITALIQQPPLMNLPYDPLKDFQPITRVAISPSVFAVQPDNAASNVKEFVAQVKANPGKFNYGTYGAGTSSHIQGELLNTQAGLDLTHVPFQGAAPLVTNMLGGQLTAAFIDSATSRPHLKSFKILAVTGPRRLPALPDVPTFAEQGFHSYEPLGWFGLLMPAGVPKPVVDKFSAEVARVLKLPDVRERIEGLGLFVGGETPEEFSAVMRGDADIYAKIIKQANIRLK
ncbi:MAG: tripartite tricarboxylate transporter substrate binding protein [Burkholderiaceae bacterium]